MGKMGASSWLSAVKKALSPTKGSERRDEQEEEDHKKTQLQLFGVCGGDCAEEGKRRWMFRKPSPYERTIEHKDTKNISSLCNTKTTRRKKSTDQGKVRLILPIFKEVAVPEQRQAMAVVTAEASVGVISLATPSIFVVKNYAAVVIQTAFRGYLARRALKALKGVVQLQAFVRGYNVRKRAKMTLQCMQSLLRVQNQVCYQRKRRSLSPLKHFYQIAETKSNSRSSTSSVTDDEYRPHKSKEANLKCENSLAHAFSRQIWKPENPQLHITRLQEARTNPREKIKTTSLFPPQNQLSVTSIGQNLLINSLTSPHRSRTRAPLKAQLEASTPPPIYMTETESAAARVRSQSAPRQRLPPLERERESGMSSAKKRLSFEVQDLYSGGFEIGEL